MESKKKKPHKYSTAFKIELISQVLDGTYTKEETALQARNCTRPLKRLWKNYYKESSAL